MTGTLEWDYGLTAFSEFVEGILMIAVDRYGAQDASGRTLLPAQPLGLLARPADPVVDPLGTPTSGAGALYFDVGSQGFVMPTTDPRLVSKIPPISKGSTVLYSEHAFLLLDGTTRDVVLRQAVTDSTAQVFSMVATEGAESIQLRHVSGSGICFSADGAVLINDKSGSGFVQLDGAGNIVLSGILQLADGAVLGDVAGALPLMTFPTYAAAMAALATALNALALVPEIIAAGAVAGQCTTAGAACTATSAGTTTKVAAS